APSFTSIRNAARKVPDASGEDFRPSAKRSPMVNRSGALHGTLALLVAAGEPRRPIFKQAGFEQIGTGVLGEQRLLDLAMGAGAAVGQKMLDGDAALGQPARHQHGAMAVERFFLRAH